MRKAAVLFLVGLSPFLLGWLLSLGMTTILPDGRLVLHRGRSGRADAVDGGLRHVWLQGLQEGHGAHHAVHQPSSAVVLVLLGVQELSLHAYWDNAVGLLTSSSICPSAPGRYCGHVDRTGVLVLFRRIPAAGAVLLAGLPGQGPSEEINFTKTGKIY